MKILVYLEKSDVRGGIEIFAERHVARLRAEAGGNVLPRLLKHLLGVLPDGIEA